MALRVGHARGFRAGGTGSGHLDADRKLTTNNEQLACGCLGDSAEPALASVELVHCGLEVGGCEIGPAAIREVKLRVGAFPEKEIAQTLLASRADQKAHVAR